MKNYNEDSILYLGFALPLFIQNEIEILDEYPHFATNKFSFSVIKSLKSAFNTVSVISTAEIRNYPSVKKMFFENSFFNDDAFEGHFIGFINIILIKHFTRLINLIPIGNKIINNYKVNYILVHGTHTPFMFYAILIKHIYKVKISLVLTDEHGVDVTGDGILGKLFRRVDNWFMKKMVKKFDAYICLSQAFVSKFELKNTLILPGIVNKIVTDNLKFDENTSKFFKIVFAGGLNPNNGVDTLLKAIAITKLDNVRFHIIGKGELMQDVIMASKVDNRIIYGGVKHSTELFETLFSADLLINPRPIRLDSSKFSFPSKLLEYMSTGVPVLTTRLECLPPEFLDCLYFTNDDSAKAISNEIINLSKISASERKIIGEKAKMISFEHFGEDAVGEKIHYLLTKNKNEV